MASRLQAIRQAVETHVTTAISGVTISNDVVSFEVIPEDQFPHAILTFAEDDPERLPFKQERRRVNGVVAIAIVQASTDDLEASREIVDLYMQTIRDAIYADEDLSQTVDDIRCDAGTAFSGREDNRVYGLLDIATEEVF